MSQFHFDPSTYLANIRADIPVFDRLQDEVATATQGIEARCMLELGTGTGETARRVLEVHPRAQLVGIDESEEMLAAARQGVQGELLVSRLEDDLPEGPFDLVFSALAIHHLDGEGKRDLFRRVGDVIRPGGTFVIGDVIVPAQPEESDIPLTPDFDRPDRLDDQLAWLEDAGFSAEPTWVRRDLAALKAVLEG